MSNKVNKSSEPTNSKEEDFEDGPKKSVPREVAEILLFGLLLLVFCKSFVWQNFQIPTSSMENTLLIGDHITANTFIFKNAAAWERAIFPFRDPKRGDVVVFKYPGAPQEDWIKRCIGVPGDRYRVEQDQVFINGKPLDEKYTYYKPVGLNETSRCAEIGYRPCDYYDLSPGLANASYRQNVNADLSDLIDKTRKKIASYRREEFSEDALATADAVMARVESGRNGEDVVIPPGFYLMMGDNRNHSADSRSWGLVPRELIEGRAYFLWWSYGEDEGSHMLTGLDLVWSYVRVPIEFFRRTHWDKTFTRIK